MNYLHIVLIVGVILRPLQMAAIGYVIIRQWRQLRHLSPFQKVKQLLILLLFVNIALYAFSFFIDMDGLFNWFPQEGLVFLVAYLAVNVFSATLTTALILAMQLVKVEGVEN